jgi:hypothetical protein
MEDSDDHQEHNDLVPISSALNCKKDLESEPHKQALVMYQNEELSIPVQQKGTTELEIRSDDEFGVFENNSYADADAGCDEGDEEEDEEEDEDEASTVDEYFKELLLIPRLRPSGPCPRLTEIDILRGISHLLVSKSYINNYLAKKVIDEDLAAVTPWLSDRAALLEVGKVLKQMGSEGSGSIKVYTAAHMGASCPCELNTA